MTISRRLPFLLLAFLIAACSDSPTAPSHNAAYAATDLRVGTGAEATAGAAIRVHYTGWLYNESAPEQKGAQFDSSIGGEPFTFTLGVGAVIAGWDQALPGMKVGGARRLVIPPALGYGSIRNRSIPPNATLLFDVELVEVPAVTQ